MGIQPAKLSQQPAKLLGLLLLALSILNVGQKVRQGEGVDFYLVWVTTLELREAEGHLDVYNDQIRRQIALKRWREARQEGASVDERFQKASDYWTFIDAVGTPFLYTAFIAATAFGYGNAYLLFQSFYVLFSLLALAAMCRILKHSLTFFCMAFVLLALFFEPYQSDLRTGNVNRLFLGLAALYVAVRYWGRQRDLAVFLGGAVLAFAAMIKPVWVFVPVFLSISKISSRRYRECALEWGGLAAGGLAALVLSSLQHGSPMCWWLWFDQLSKIDVGGAARGNYAVAGLIHKLSGISVSSLVLAALGAAPAATASWLQGRRLACQPEGAAGRVKANRFFICDFQQLCLGLLLMLLCVKLVWLHYYLLSVPAILLLLRPQTNEQASWPPWRRVLTLIAAMLISLHTLIQFFELHSPTTYAWICVAGGLLLYCLLLADMLHLRPEAGNGKQPQAAGEPDPHQAWPDSRSPVPQ